MAVARYTLAVDRRFKKDREAKQTLSIALLLAN